MAVHRTARVVETRLLAPHTRLLDLELTDGAPFGFRGGQYLIMNTGAPLADGKVAKRTYSLLSADARQDRVQLAVKALPAGPGSAAMHAMGVGAELTFSGPWGKLAPEETATGATLLFCTDTGITAALGVVQGRAFAALAPRAEVLWYVEAESFVPEAFVRERLEAVGVGLRIVPALPVLHPERVDHARAALDRAVAERVTPDHALLAGDGHVIYPLREEFLARGTPDAQIRLEPFFHNPARKAPT